MITSIVDTGRADHGEDPRALISNGDFPQYWTFHTHREREGLYPRPDQHNYELLA